MTLWEKTHFAHPDAALFEAAGLRWLAEVGDGARTATVVDVESGLLRLERVEDGTPSPSTARVFGAALARTHAAGAPGFGWVPGTAPAFMGRAALPPPADPAPTSWGEFYAGQRVLPFLRTAVDQGRIDDDGRRVVERVATRLASGDLDHDQPALVPGAAARLHGDLWSGNVLWPDGHAVLIDPTAHGGHAETDLAMLTLFGAPHRPEIIAGYHEVSALAPGWRDRVALHQLNPLLVHAVLFGGSYADEAVAAARPYA